MINLAADKDAVLTEAIRVLAPGGRFAVSDIVVRGSIPAELREGAPLWAKCLAGAMEESEYRAKLAAAGFTDVDVQPTRVFTQAGGARVPRRRGPAGARRPSRAARRREGHERLRPREQAGLRVALLIASPTLRPSMTSPRKPIRGMAHMLPPSGAVSSASLNG